MPSVTTQTVTAILPDTIGQSTPAIVRSWITGLGSRPSEVTIELPTTHGTAQPYDQQLPIKLYRGTTPIFHGHTVETITPITDSDTTVTLRAVDVRYAMAAKQIGQYGIGPTDTIGGWPGYGYDLRFNPDGRPNRSASPEASGVYTFDSTPSAQPWTYAQLLQFLFFWYVDSDLITLQTGNLDGSFDTVLPGYALQIGTLPANLDRILSTLGGTWSLTYTGSLGDDTPPYFQPVTATSTPPVTHPIHLNDRDHKAPPSVYSASSATITRSTRRSYDNVEVSSSPLITEATFASRDIYDAGMPTLLVRHTDTVDILGYHGYFDVDVTQYAAANLGASLAAGSLPKPWHSHLVTRIDPDTYNSSGAAVADRFVAPGNPGVGEPVQLGNWLWISVNSGDSWVKVKSGVRIDPQRCRVYYRPTITTDVYRDGEPLTFTIDATGTLDMAITAAVTTEYPQIAGSTSTYLPIPRTKRILRRDLQPTARAISFAAIAPSDTGNDSTIPSNLTATYGIYDTVLPQLETIRDELVAARQTSEIAVTLRLPFAPMISHGDAITVTPAELSLGTLRVTGVNFDPATLDTSISATNNLDRS